MVNNFHHICFCLYCLYFECSWMGRNNFSFRPCWRFH